MNKGLEIPRVYVTNKEKLQIKKKAERNYQIGDIVYVSNPDEAYEAEYGNREHRAFFGRVTEVEKYDDNSSCITVLFPETPNGYKTEWSYMAEELSPASEVNDLSLEEFSNRFGVTVLAEYLI